jgi:hypothetical protein
MFKTKTSEEIMKKKCCIDCFDEESIIKKIKSFEEKGYCHYCEAKRKKFVSQVGWLIDFIVEGVERYYEDANGSVGHSSKDGYHLPTTYFGEILADLFIFSDETSGQLESDLNTIIGSDKDYVHKDPYGSSPGDPEHISIWQKFSESVKHSDRFTVFLHDFEDGFFFSNRYLSFFEELVSFAFPSRIDKIEKGTNVYRSRINQNGQKFKHKDLTSPPKEFSVNNRMSPLGVSFFYCSLKPETCIYEVRPEINEEVVVGKFRTLKELNILDLSKDITFGMSIFNENYDYFQEEIYKPFLRNFINDISKPIRSSDKDLAYLPTQIFTEFIKNSKFDEGKLDGIMFNSSFKNDGKNLVLFKDHGISIPDNNEDSGANWLKYVSQKTYRVSSIELGIDPIKD